MIALIQSHIKRALANSRRGICHLNSPKMLSFLEGKTLHANPASAKKLCGAHEESAFFPVSAFLPAHDKFSLANIPTTTENDGDKHETDALLGSQVRFGYHDQRADSQAHEPIFYYFDSTLVSDFQAFCAASTGHYNYFDEKESLREY